MRQSGTRHGVGAKSALSIVRFPPYAAILPLLLLIAPLASGFPVVFSDQGTDAKSAGSLVGSGDLTVQIWDSPTGGTMLYSDTFSGAIVNGSWNVMLGEATALSLEYGVTYYKDYRINGVDLDFTTSSGVMARLPFVSPLGAVDLSKTQGISSQPSIDAANLTSGTISNSRLDAAYLITSNECSAGQYYVWGSGCTAIPGGSAQQPSVDAANITAGTIINARYNMSYLAQAADITGLWGNASDQQGKIHTLQSSVGVYYDNISALQGNVSSAALNISILWANASNQQARIGSLPTAIQPAIDASNISSGVILNARYNQTFLLNVSGCGSTQYWVYGSGCTAVPSGGSAQPNINGANITSGVISNLRYNTSYLIITTLPQDNNITLLWANASDQQTQLASLRANASSHDGRIVALESAPAGVPYWSNISGFITSNSTINSGNVLVSGNLTVAGALVVGPTPLLIVNNSRVTVLGDINVTGVAYINNMNATGNLSLNGSLSLYGNILPNGSQCADGQVMKRNGLVWVCADDISNGSSSYSPFWVNASGVITSNASIKGGNVNVTGNLTVVGNLRSEGSNATGIGSVALGIGSQATGNGAVVSGGDHNEAKNTADTASGGGFNVANGGYSVVSGGYMNNATNLYSVAAGGRGNLAAGTWSVVSGGRFNTAEGDLSVVIGGWENTASGWNSLAFGNSSNATGTYSVAFGQNVQALAVNSFAFGKAFTNSQQSTFMVGFGPQPMLVVNGSLVTVLGDLNVTGTAYFKDMNLSGNAVGLPSGSGSSGGSPYWTGELAGIYSNRSIGGGSVNVTGGLWVNGSAAFYGNILPNGMQCIDGQVMKRSGLVWVCADDLSNGSSPSTPYWVKVSGTITSNASISGGNVDVTGNLNVSGIYLNMIDNIYVNNTMTGDLACGRLNELAIPGLKYECIKCRDIETATDVLCTTNSNTFRYCACRSYLG